MLTARQIVKKAIKAIPENFPRNPFSTIGYYRDYQKKNSAYINLNEAIIEIFDAGFDQMDFESTKVKLYDYKNNIDFKRDSLPASKYDYKSQKKIMKNAYLASYGGNELVILRFHDAIRNYKMNSYDFVNDLETDLFNNHDFKKEVDTYFENEMLYVVSISNEIPNYSVKGRFFISRADFAIHRMEYEILETPKKTTRKKVNYNRMKPQLLFKVTTEYRRRNDSMYLNYISLQNSFQIARPPKFRVNEIVVNMKCKCFEVRYNRTIDPISAGEKKNYTFKFAKRKIRFKMLVVFEKSVRLFPDLPANKIDDMFDKIYAARKNPQLDELISTEIEGIRDFDEKGGKSGTLLNERIIEDYLQFREFFAQQVLTNTRVPLNGSFMDKNRPIFENQPTERPDNFDDYWMNTPLQTVEK